MRGPGGGALAVPGEYEACESFGRVEVGFRQNRLYVALAHVEPVELRQEPVPTLDEVSRDLIAQKRHDLCVAQVLRNEKGVRGHQAAWLRGYVAVWLLQWSDAKMSKGNPESPTRPLDLRPLTFKP